MNKEHGNTGKRNAAKTETLSARFNGRCFPDEKNNWLIEAANRGLNLQTFIRQTLNEACK